MGQQQSLQINIPGELAANSVATEKPSATRGVSAVITPRAIMSSRIRDIS